MTKLQIINRIELLKTRKADNSRIINLRRMGEYI